MIHCWKRQVNSKKSKLNAIILLSPWFKKIREIRIPKSKILPIKNAKEVFWAKVNPFQKQWPSIKQLVYHDTTIGYSTQIAKLSWSKESSITRKITQKKGNNICRLETSRVKKEPNVYTRCC